MIKSFKHKGLERFYVMGVTSGIQAKHANRLRSQLAILEAADTIEAINIPSLDLHRLKGKRADIWSIKVSGNWRMTFEFVDGNVYILNYEDYH